MDCRKAGQMIRALRLEHGMTQAELAEMLSVSPKTVSKWENGNGCPDVSLLAALSGCLGVELETLLSGEPGANGPVGGNMKKTKYFVCPVCGSITLSTGEASISCCGRKLAALVPKKAEAAERLTVETVENDWYITSSHAMTKEDYISFVAFQTGDRVQLVKQYPEWNLQVRTERRGHGMLLWYSAKEGLLYQLV
ncbi:MAG: helix-turn-helix transcriptional regulator [bacterium]|nr:helix-turn-helix transcriptional regulator [bacterium]